MNPKAHQQSIVNRSSIKEQVIIEARRIDFYRKKSPPLSPTCQTIISLSGT